MVTKTIRRTLAIIVALAILITGMGVIIANAQTQETMPVLDATKITHERGFVCPKVVGVVITYEQDQETGLIYREVKIRNKTYFIGLHAPNGSFVSGWLSREGDGVVTESGGREYFLTKYPQICDMLNSFEQKNL